VFAAKADDPTGMAQLFVVNADRPGPTELGGPDMFGVSPAWSPDGKQIVYKRTYPCCGRPPDTLWLITPDGFTASQLSPTTGTAESLVNTTWSPDGQRLAFLAPGRDNNDDIYVINADTTGQVDLTNSPADELWPSWSPDGKRLAFSVFIGGGGTYVMNADGSHLIAIYTGAGSASNSVWSPDGSRIVGYVDNSISSRAIDSLVVLDPTNKVDPLVIPAAQFGSTTWQRLAP
jgi:TolB protein